MNLYRDIKKNWSFESGFVVENARLLSLECKKTAQNKDRFSATFLKNTQERHEREKKTRAFSFSSKKKKL